MTKDMISQEEIDLILKGTDDESEDYMDNGIITEAEKDTLGEIGNISMGTAATTLSSLLRRKVVITTPKVALTSTRELSDEYPIPFVAVDVSYKEGLEGSNILMMNVDDVKIITDIMIGNEIDLNRELTEIDLSAVSEAMNQMIGSACTSLSDIFKKKIDILPPRAYEITVKEGRKTLDVLKSEDPIIKVSFKMVVEDLIDSELMQLIPLSFGQEIVEDLINNGSTSFVEEILEDNSSMVTENIGNLGTLDNELHNKSVEKSPKISQNNDKIEKEQVVIKKPQFESFDTTTDVSYNESIDLVGDIPVELTAELGRTTKKISEILEYGPGTVLELDKLVGEPLNIYANGKYIARGEVVVIDDNFGIRITDIDNSYNE